MRGAWAHVARFLGPCILFYFVGCYRTIALVARNQDSRERGVGTRRLHSESVAAETPPSCDFGGVLGPACAGARLGSYSGRLLFHATGRPYQVDRPSFVGDQPTGGASCLLVVAVQSTARLCSSTVQLALQPGSVCCLVCQCRHQKRGTHHTHPTTEGAALAAQTPFEVPIDRAAAWQEQKLCSKTSV